VIPPPASRSADADDEREHGSRRAVAAGMYIRGKNGNDKGAKLFDLAPMLHWMGLPSDSTSLLPNLCAGEKVSCLL